MLSALNFETVAPHPAAAPNRADVACFIGCVARRAGTLPDPVRSQLRMAGWIGGPWAVPPARVDDLRQLPVTLDSWEAFERLFAWERRTVRDGVSARCATYLGAAVRSFFANGGRRAVIVRVGDPWPYLGGPDRIAERAARLSSLLPWRFGTARPFTSTEPNRWRGLEHLYGLPEVSHVCLPDLADICAVEPEPPETVNAALPLPEVFVECSAHEPAPIPDQELRFVKAPRLDVEGFSDWTRAIDQARLFLSTHRRDALLIGALPLPRRRARQNGQGAHAQSDWLGFLQGVGVLEDAANAEGFGLHPDSAGGNAASAFVQLTWPWLKTTRSSDLPEQLEPADGTFAGVLAANAITRGTFRSVAGTRLAEAIAPEPMPDLGLGTDSPSARLAQRVCLIGPEPEGITVLSDVTTSMTRAWRQGGASRLMAAVLRAAQRIGEQSVFEPNGPALWSRIRSDMEALLDAFRVAGGLGGNTAEDAYDVRCDRSTMSQNDLDNGRVRVQVTVLPAMSIERITFALELTTSGASLQQLGEVA